VPIVRRRQEELSQFLKNAFGREDDWITGHGGY